MSSYPTAIDYRRPRGTVRTSVPPNRPRRSPGRPAPLPRPPALPRAPAGWAGALRGLGPLALGFEIGFALGWVIFAPRPTELVVYNPAGWAQYICPTVPGGIIGPVSTQFANVPGVSPSNCISGQFVSGSGTNLRRGFWWKYGPGANQHSHVASFTRGAAPNPFPDVSLTPAGRPFPMQDAQFATAVGRAIWGAPLASPIISPVPNVGPVAWPLTGPGSNMQPAPGVGNEGYASGQPSPRPAPRPQPLPGASPANFPQRPPRGTKETKVRANRAVQLLGWAYGQLTEAEDLVDSFHEAIRKGCGKKAGPVWDPTAMVGKLGEDGKNWYRKPGGKWVRRVGAYRKPTLAEKAAQVYRYWHCIDMDAAIRNIVENAIEDAILASLSGPAKKSSKKDFEDPFGIRRGYEFGPAL